MITKHGTGTATAIPNPAFPTGTFQTREFQTPGLPSSAVQAPAIQAPPAPARRSRGFWITALSGLAAMYPVDWDGGWMFDEAGRLMPGWDPNVERGQ